MSGECRSEYILTQDSVIELNFDAMEKFSQETRFTLKRLYYFRSPLLLILRLFFRDRTLPPV